jgi:hypothetical protein
MNWFATHSYIAEWAALVAAVVMFLIQKKTQNLRAGFPLEKV